MSFRQKLQFQLVKILGVSNKDAAGMIAAGKVKINDIPITTNEVVFAMDDIEVDGKIIKGIHQKTFIVLNKPRGIECTFNPEIQNNILSFLPKIEGLFYLGRLDKESQGLMFFSNEGKIHDKVLRNQNREVLKKYLVRIDRKIDSRFIERMENGIEILGQKTLPCKLEKLDDFSFYIWLNQGLNRQIRRMCFQLGAEVLFLERLEIGEIKLGDLNSGEFRSLHNQELNYLRSLLTS